ncbi:MAG TPA: redoxin domain-containing protein [Thermodesulfobacteriota bacterium]|nr:redoxin domain-containing protein [Deltaproteobacteria bacterium]HNR14159.1 redoxin domain-containing protein [Thermodesulfobacteriota bacterium]HNU72683.1 redoxin domain-containing protein [Thermodesulfobacteriota bacterium]HOC39012.1 redoxin domain-containing protein [Thermodesulfobacteriota bacterium]HQO76990.1 redoxin domain-containing protein [Thermodesulfobacteriota bacterium]
MKTISGFSRQHECSWWAVIIGFVSFWIVTGCAGSSAGKSETVPAPVSASVSSAIMVPDFSLPVPEQSAAREYLGIKTDASTFSLSQIDASVLFIEVFNMYCPHCQAEAPKLNELYRQIEASPELGKKLKIIGIAVANTPFEVNLFREKYSVLFPLFPDEDSSITKDLGAQVTPTFIGIRLEKQGGHPRFFFKGGSFDDAAEMLQLLKQEAGIRTE